MKKGLYILILLVILALAVVGFFMTQGKSEISPEASMAAVGLVGTSEVPVEQPKVESSGNRTYRDNTYGFSLSYPKDYTIGKFAQGEGDTILLQDSKGVGMQILVSPFDESLTKLTADRIRKDLPDLPMKNVREVTLPGANIPAIAFESSGGGFGDSIEVWFIARGNLYQGSTYLSQISLLESVLGTFTF